jgi:hypothetical protein
MIKVYLKIHNCPITRIEGVRDISVLLAFFFCSNYGFRIENSNIHMDKILSLKSLVQINGSN